MIIIIAAAAAAKKPHRHMTRKTVHSCGNLTCGSTRYIANTKIGS